jgi:type VI secretion system protein VasG
MKRGNGRGPAMSQMLVKMLTEAWLLGSVDYGAGQIRSAFTILALYSNDDLARVVRDVSKELQKIQPDALRQNLVQIVAGSHEDAITAAAEEPGEAAPGAERPRGAGGKTPNLDQYTINLTERAKGGKIDPVLGRDFEIRQVVDILTRRRQNNPILTGEAGVGKTAVVEGFAQRLVDGDVPESLRNVTVRTLDLALLQAGAGIKGEFENRLKGLVEEVKSSPTPIILFIDEAHTMIGAGGAAGQNDAANILKPALARGELRTIAATTWSEYKKYFEKDPALARRFQVVKVEEPTEEKCRLMLRGLVPMLEKHHNVRILDEGLAAAQNFPTVTCRIDSCRIKPSACWTRRARDWRLGRTRFPRRSKMPCGRSTIWACRHACWSARARSARIIASGWSRSRNSAPRLKVGSRPCANAGKKRRALSRAYAKCGRNSKGRARPRSPSGDGQAAVAQPMTPAFARSWPS